MALAHFALLAVASAAGSGVYEPSEVYELDARSFKKTSEGAWLIEFCARTHTSRLDAAASRAVPRTGLTRCAARHLRTDAPWCAHCKKLAPTYEKIANHYHRRDGAPRVRVGKVDGSAHPGIAEPFDVKGYPTLLVLRDGKQLAEVSGPRTFEGITAFVDDAVGGEAPPRKAKPSTAAPKKRGSRRGGGWRSQLTAWRASLAWLGELDPLHAALGMLALTVSGGVCAVLALCATTSASPR